MAKTVIQPERIHASGFTLIELSIVLVIIGLLVGGILTGQDLMRAAQVRSQIKQIQDFQLAITAFQGKYNCLPGDCVNATQFFGATDSFGYAVNNGNGNGAIDTANGTEYEDMNSTWPLSTELWGALQQLGMANMTSFIPSTPSVRTLGKGVPQVAINPSGGFFIGASYNFQVGIDRNPNINTYQKGANALWMVACNMTSNQMDVWDNNCAIFTAQDLLSIDQKIDDGMPLSGNLFGFGGWHTAATPVYNDCLNNTSGSIYVYKISNNTAQCQAGYVLN